MKNLLIGAISGNYNPTDIERWVTTSKFKDTKRVLLLYNNTKPELVSYLRDQDVEVVVPDFNFHNTSTTSFETNTGTMTVDSSYLLVHNIRFLHIAHFLKDAEFEKVFITDVKDVYFNQSPFDRTPNHGIIATGEVIKYKDDPWNVEHLITNLGIFGYDLWDSEVLNVGVFGGDKDSVMRLCRDIYLMSCGKHKVADQTSFNYLIRTTYSDLATVTSIQDNFAVHLHVVSTGQVPFDLSRIPQYTIIHQYDRL